MFRYVVRLTASLLAFLGLLAIAQPVEAADLRELRLDYATYSPLSLILKEFGWVEEEFEPEGTTVRWVFSLGSANANENLRSRAVDFASTAGAAALNARAQGVPLVSVYILFQPEWTALVTRADSGIHSVEQLKGKRIAAHLGTDPWFFTLRTLEAHGLSTRDVTIVNIPHPEGRIALQRGDVDAWAGLDPHMADAQLTNGNVLLYRNLQFNTYGTLNVLESFLAEHPTVVERVVRLYERARRWALAHPEETAAILAEYGRIDLAVAELQLKERSHFISPVPGAEVYEALAGIVPLLATIPNNLPRRADPQAALDTLFHPDIVARVVAEFGGEV